MFLFYCEIEIFPVFFSLFFEILFMCFHVLHKYSHVLQMQLQRMLYSSREPMYFNIDILLRFKSVII